MCMNFVRWTRWCSNPYGIEHTKNCLPSQKDIKTPLIKNHFGHIWYHVMFPSFAFGFQHPSQTYMIRTIGMFCRYECAYGLNDHCNDLNRARSIKWKYLVAFNQIVIHMTWCNRVMVLLSNTHLSECWINTWSTWSWIINSHVTICFSNFNFWKITNLVVMFVDLEHIPNGSNFKDDGEVNGNEGFIDISLIKTWRCASYGWFKVEAFNELESSIVPLEGILVCLYHTMQEITKECTQGRVAFSTLFITTTNHGF